jgi:phage terminase large subunit-like protein
MSRAPKQENIEALDILEWVRAEVGAGRLSRIALVGATLADVREVMRPSAAAGA